VLCIRKTATGAQAVLDLGFSVIWSDLDAVWLRDFQKLAPRGLEVVLVDDSEAEEERHSDNTGTGMQPPHPHVLPGIKHLLAPWHIPTTA
jgi:hypothetical protein